MRESIVEAGEIVAYCSMFKDVGVRRGFVGCIEFIHINSSQTTVNFDLTDDSSRRVLHRVNVGQLFNIL